MTTNARSNASSSAFAAVTDPLVLNIFPARFSADRAQVWVGLWLGAEHAASIADAGTGIVTWRDPTDESRLYVWSSDRVIVPTSVSA